MFLGNLTKEEKIIKIIRWLFFLKGAIWVVFSVVHLFRGFWILAGLSFVNAIVFLWLNRMIAKKKKWIFWFAGFFVGLNIFLTIIGQFGWFDFLILVIDSILFVLILGNKKVLIDK